jgi:hypothetical protein
LVGGALGLGREDVLRGPVEVFHLRVGLVKARAVDGAAMLGNILQGVEDALVMGGGGKDAGDVGAIVAAQVGDNDVWVVPFGTQRQQEGRGSEQGGSE